MIVIMKHIKRQKSIEKPKVFCMITSVGNIHAVVEVTKKHPNGRRSDIYIDFGDSKLAVEF